MKILVVEDDELIAQTLSAILSMYHYAVEVVHDGISALEMLEAFEFDAILLDVLLPKLNGLEVCKQARAKGIQIPILMLTARDSTQDKAAGLDAGADDYLIKPFDPEELIARVRALLRRSRVTQTPTLGVGRLSLDPESCEVKYDGEPIPLTPKEYALLELFLRHPKRVYSCGMILEHLWTNQDAPGEEAVRTHIKGLRHKLKVSGAGSDVITTVYGIGYRLKPQAEVKQGMSPTIGVGTDGVGTEQTSLESPAPAQDLSQKIEGLWKSHQGAIANQVNLLEVAVQAAAAHTLSQQSRATAITNAHSLAGSLGTFGVHAGSKIARSIELILMPENHLTPADIQQLQQWIEELKQAIHQKSTVSEAPLPSPFSLESTILIFLKDGQLSDTVTKQAQQLGYSIQRSTSLKNGLTLVENIQPVGIILDPTIEASAPKLRTFLKDVHAHKAQTPIVLYVDEKQPVLTDLSPEIKVLDPFVMSHPSSEAEVLQAIQWMVKQTRTIEATILAIDDDASILDVLRVLLEPWGMLVHTLNEPRQFWPVLESVQPDLVILDVEMPQCNGIELCTNLRAKDHWSEIPVLFLTVHGNEEIVNQIFSAGADDYIQKPLVGPELVTRILNRLERNRLLRRSHSAQSQTLGENLTVFQGMAPAQKKLFPNAMIKLLNIADDAIICMDHQQQIIFFNRGAEKIFGYAASEILGRPLNDLMPTRYAMAHRQHVDKFGGADQSAKQMGQRQEIYGLRKDQSEFPAEASIAKLWEGEDTIYAVILRDISIRKQEEQNKNNFITVISHEFRTPLTSILGSLEMLTRGLQHNKAQDSEGLLSIAVSSTRRLVDLVNQIIELERIDRGTVDFNLQIVDLVAIARDAVQSLQEIDAEKAISIDTKLESVRIRADRDQIHQALINILRYCIHTSDDRQTCWLKVHLQAERARLEVWNQGEGLSTEQVNHIFEKFHVNDLAEPNAPQTANLSLALSYSIIRQHHGAIWVESEPGKGTHFFVTFPHQST